MSGIALDSKVSKHPGPSSGQTWRKSSVNNAMEERNTKHVKGRRLYPDHFIYFENDEIVSQKVMSNPKLKY